MLSCCGLMFFYYLTWKSGNHQYEPGVCPRRFPSFSLPFLIVAWALHFYAKTWSGIRFMAFLKNSKKSERNLKTFKLLLLLLIWEFICPTANPKNLKIEPKEIQKIKDIYEKFRKSKKDPEHPNNPRAAQKSQKSSLQSMSNMEKIFRMHTTCIYPAWMACDR